MVTFWCALSRGQIVNLHDHCGMFLGLRHVASITFLATAPPKYWKGSQYTGFYSSFRVNGMFRNELRFESIMDKINSLRPSALHSLEYFVVVLA